MKKFGHCFECGRLMPVDKLLQVEYYEGHIHNGDYHHKLLCLSCIKKAEELGKSFPNLSKGQNQLSKK